MSRAGGLRSDPHLDTEELLELRDGRGREITREHVASCASCHRELEQSHQLRARLRALPELTPPRDRYSEVRERIVAERRRIRIRLATRALLAAAGLLLLLATGVELRERARADRAAEVLRTRVATLREQSQLLDAELRALAERRMSGRRAEALLVLEDDLQRMDEQLASFAEPAEDRKQPSLDMLENRLVLWSARLEVQSTMIHVHHAEPFRAGSI
jgi:hypothetical protein